MEVIIQPDADSAAQRKRRMAGEDRRTGVAGLSRRIPDLVRKLRKDRTDFLGQGARLLQTKNVGSLVRQKGKGAPSERGADTVDVPGDELHRERLRRTSNAWRAVARPETGRLAANF